MELKEFDTPYRELDATPLPRSSSSFVDEKPLPLSQALKNLFLDTIPTFVFFGSIVLIWTFNFYWAGQVGDSDLTSAVGLANTWMSAMSLFVILGLNIGTSANCAQALGAKQYRIVGITFHRALIMRFVIAIVTYPLIYFSGYVFKYVGVDEDVALQAGFFCQCQVVVIIFTVLYDTFKALVMAHNVYTPFIFIQAGAITAHWFLLAYFTKVIEDKVVGINVAMSCTYILLFVLLILYIIVKQPCKESLFFFERDSFRCLFKQLKEEAPIGGILYLDFAAFEFVTLISGSYPPVQLTAQILTYNVMNVMVLPALGLNATLTTYVGNAIGEGHVSKTSQYMKAGYILTAIFIIIEAPVLYFVSTEFAGLYSGEDDVILATASSERIYAFSIISDFIMLVMTAILRGIGKEHTACIIFATGYYAIGLPLSFTFGTMWKWYTAGIWLGLACGYLFNAIVTTIAVLRVDLATQVKKISLRISTKA